MGWNLFRKKAKKAAPVPLATIRRLEQIRDLYMESAGIMEKTKNLTTFLSRYEDARRFISGFNSIMVQAGQAPIPEMNDDIDALFVGRVGEVVSEEVAAAQKLKTASGRQDRLQRVVDALERVDRPDEGPVDDAILEAEDLAFRAIGQAVDWASEPPGSDISVSEDLILKSMKEAAFRDGRRRGLSDSQIEEAWRKTFGK
jgi:hypothetical protein